MSNHDNDYDEVVFALYYDHELDPKEAKLFEIELEKNEELMQSYNLWVDTQEALFVYLEQQEEKIDLKGFSERVMKALPDQPQWKLQSPQKPVTQVESNSQMSWWKTWITPMLVGGLVVAAIMLVVQNLGQENSSMQRSTVLINYPDQEEQGEKVPVIWLLDEEESAEDVDDITEEDHDAEDI